MQHKNGVQKYKNTARIVSRARQIVLLYEGAVRFLNKAKEASDQKNFQERYDNLNKVAQIVNGLSLSLNHSKGVEVAAALKKFYNNLYLQVMSLHDSQNAAKYAKVEEQLQIVLGAWREIEAQTHTTLKSSQQI